MLFIVVVVYNKTIEEICSINQFLDIVQKDDVHIVVFDNSSEEFRAHNQIIASDLGIIYLTQSKNSGIAEAFNYSYKYISENYKEDYYVMFSDDDTNFSTEYLSNVLHEICKKKNIISGIIKTSDGSFSPNDSLNLLHRGFITHSGDYKDIFCVNTGLTMSKNILGKIFPINKNLFVDMVDYWIFYKLKSLKLDFVTIVPGNIEQNFSGSKENNNKDQLKSRFNIYKKDCLTFAKDFKSQVIPIIFLICKRKVSILTSK